MTKSELLQAVDHFGGDDEIFVLIDCNSDCYPIYEVARVFANPRDDCDRGTQGDSDSDRISRNRSDWTPAIGLTAGF